MTTWRSVEIPLREHASAGELIAIGSLLDNLTRELHTQLSDSAVIEAASKLSTLHSSGYFRDEYTSLAGKPHLSWEGITGNKAKYQRMLIETIRVALLSLRDRRAIAIICEEFEWDTSRLPAIRESLTKDKLYPSAGLLRNILHARAIPSVPRTLNASLDFTTGDKQIVTQGVSSRHIKTRVRVGKEWIELNLPLPSHARGGGMGKWAKPVISRSPSGEVIARYAYEITIPPRAHSTGVLGVDLGKVKPFTAAGVFEDGSYTTELSMSREAEHLSRRIDTIRGQTVRVTQKLEQITRLLTGRDNPYLAVKHERLTEERDRARDKITRLKEQLRWLIARDIVSHSQAHDLSTIHVENLAWLDSRGGKWDHSATLAKVEQIAELHGIEVTRVSARNSSHTDPFTGDGTTPNWHRLTQTRIGALDRDYAAALEIAARTGRKKRGKRTATMRRPTPGRCRDKHAPTPKRPRIISRTRAQKQRARQARAQFAILSEASTAVTLSGEASLAHLTPTRARNRLSPATAKHTSSSTLTPTVPIARLPSPVADE